MNYLDLSNKKCLFLFAITKRSGMFFFFLGALMNRTVAALMTIQNKAVFPWNVCVSTNGTDT